MQLYNEIQELKRINKEQANALQEIKETVASELKESILNDINTHNEVELTNTQEAIKYENDLLIKEAIKNAVSEATATLASEQAHQVTRLFNDTFASLNDELHSKLESTHKENTQLFIQESQETTKTILQDSINETKETIASQAITNVESIARDSLNEITQNTKEATKAMLESERENIQSYCNEASKNNLESQIKAQLAINDNLLEIHKIRFQSALMLSAISLSRELAAIGITPIQATQETTTKTQEVTQSVFMNKSYAVR